MRVMLLLPLSHTCSEASDKTEHQKKAL
jgi:hypothetical protein